MTRTGSREIYKILEFVIRTKLPEIGKNPDVSKGLYHLYVTSGLCSEKLITDLKRVQSWEGRGG